VRRFLLGEILSHYYSPGPVLLDAADNMHRERLPDSIEQLFAAAARVAEPAISADEALRYYRFRRRMWGSLQRLRQIDRWRQRTVLRRCYPFLLPGKTER